MKKQKKGKEEKKKKINPGVDPAREITLYTRATLSSRRVQATLCKSLGARLSIIVVRLPDRPY